LDKAQILPAALTDAWNIKQLAVEGTCSWGNVRMPERSFPLNRVLLVVDDEPLMCWALKERLRTVGYQVLAAPDAASALSHFGDGTGAESVDLVLLDLKLPDTDGFSLFRQIKQLNPTCHVIMMTAFGTPETTAEAQRLGAYRVLDKPFDLDDVVALVGEALASRTGSRDFPRPQARQ
jgi:DNA-binding NtrC family response regulator